MIVKEFWPRDNTQVFFKFKEFDELTDSVSDICKPYICFNLGIKMHFESWAGMETLCQGEDGFVMCGEAYANILNKLKSLIENYKEDEIVISDFEGDTDAVVKISCEKKRVVVSGHFGSNYNWDKDDDNNLLNPVVKFKFETTSDFIIKLYEIFNEMTLY